jgi:hypothetical protein
MVHVVTGGPGTEIMDPEMARVTAGKDSGPVYIRLRVCNSVLPRKPISRATGRIERARQAQVDSTQVPKHLRPNSHFLLLESGRHGP